jgi:hypothetical protein
MEKKTEDESTSTLKRKSSFPILSDQDENLSESSKTLRSDKLKRQLDNLAFKLRLLYGRK